MHADQSPATVRSPRFPQVDHLDRILADMLEQIQQQALRAPKPEGRPS